MSAIIIVQYQAYQCSECGDMLVFEPCVIQKVEFAVGCCTRWHNPDCVHPNCNIHEGNCRMAHVRIKIPITRIECEVLQ